MPWSGKSKNRPFQKSSKVGSTILRAILRDLLKKKFQGFSSRKFMTAPKRHPKWLLQHMLHTAKISKVALILSKLKNQLRYFRHLCPIYEAKYIPKMVQKNFPVGSYSAFFKYFFPWIWLLWSRTDQNRPIWLAMFQAI